MNEPDFEVTPLVGDTNCMVKQNGGRCGNPGDFHLLIDVTDAGGMVACLCSSCFDEVCGLASSEPLAHPIGANCGMPGTHWSLMGCYVL